MKCDGTPPPRRDMLKALSQVYSALLMDDVSSLGNGLYVYALRCWIALQSFRAIGSVSDVTPSNRLSDAIIR
eukprot:711496-Pyramimonas_sp.AAC.1